MITLQEKSIIRALLMKDNKELLEWVSEQSDVPDFLVEPFDNYCHGFCEHYRAKSEGGCSPELTDAATETAYGSELSCFVAWYEYDPQGVREELVLAHNDGHWCGGESGCTCGVSAPTNLPRAFFGKLQISPIAKACYDYAEGRIASEKYELCLRNTLEMYARF